MSERAGRACPAGCGQRFLTARAAGQHLRREHRDARTWRSQSVVLTDGGDDEHDEHAELQALAEFIRR